MEQMCGIWAFKWYHQTRRDFEKTQQTFRSGPLGVFRKTSRPHRSLRFSELIHFGLRVGNTQLQERVCIIVVRIEVIFSEELTVKDVRLSKQIRDHDILTLSAFEKSNGHLAICSGLLAAKGPC